MNHIPEIQMTAHLTGLRCLFLVALHHGIQVTPDRLAVTDDADTTGSLLRLMKEVGLTGKLFRNRRWKDVITLGSACPVIAERKDGSWVILTGVVAAGDGGYSAVVLDPRNEKSGITVVPQVDFEDLWSGSLIFVKRKFRLTDPAQPFGFRWFLPEIARQGRHFRDVAIAAVMSSMIALATPLFFQIMIDKVIPHHSYQTLVAVVIAFIVTMSFDAVFSYVRQYLMLFATNKIDARLASRTFDHLLKLPMSVFETTSAGVLLRHMQQTETIRGFLTGRLFQTFLDTFTMPVLLFGLCLYSGMLTMVVIAFAAMIAAVIGVMIPTFRRYLEQLYAAEGARQADLVETIHGMRTVKSLALEGLRMKSWEAKVASSIKRRATVGYFGAVAVVVTSSLQQLMQLAVLGLGAKGVFDGTLSIGALVAFNMLSGRVTGPLVQIVSLINEYQQAELSVKMLGHVMNQQPERNPNQRGVRPLITGQMAFEGVTFRYPGSATAALDDVSFTIEEGQVIGVVGRSGSGKTTLTRLVQGIHSAQEGIIRLNGTDLRHIDLPHLRRSIGVVLQDNILFRGTVRDNIAAAKPDASLSEVMEAARLAGAEEFIDRLPMSYETMVEEGASNFSGGQKQRLAIARALLLKPRLLLFDEATSALDPESEAIVQQNLNEIARGRTMMIVSHRLSSLVGSDSILVLDRGKVVDFAPHSTLVERCDIYRHLWQQQTGHLQC